MDHRVTLLAGALLTGTGVAAGAAAAPAWVGPITPIGGVGLLAGWAYLIVAAFAAKGD